MRPRLLTPAAIALLALSVFPVRLFAAGPTPYHLELQITPKAAFPWLGHLGDIDVDVYPGGVRGEALWLQAISRNGSPTVRVNNVIGRTYMDMKTGEIGTTLTQLAGRSSGAEREVRPSLAPPLSGKVGGIAATRNRLVYGDQAWIDVWTTTAIPQNPQYRLLVAEVLNGIAPGTAPVANALRGTPIYVELNFRRFKKLPVVKLKKLTMSSKGEAEALAPGRLYVPANLFDKLLGR